MVRLTQSLLLTGISKFHRDKKDPDAIDFSKITSLHLQNKNIDTLKSLEAFHSLTILYLYENAIETITGLERATNLELLYLQKNNIKSIDNLGRCSKLRKLYLGYNEIQVVEGLQDLHCLQELHMEHQRLPLGSPLIFCPFTLETLSNCLKLFNVTGNQIAHLQDLANMEVLDTLIVAKNEITDPNGLAVVLSTLACLRVLDLRENPVTRFPKYKEKVIGFSANIEILDGKNISETTRTFMHRFCSMKSNKIQKDVADFREKSASRRQVAGLKSDIGQFMLNSQTTDEIYGPRFEFSTPVARSPVPSEHSEFEMGDGDGFSKDLSVSVPQLIIQSPTPEAGDSQMESPLVHKEDEDDTTFVPKTMIGQGDQLEMSEMAKTIFHMSDMEITEQSAKVKAQYRKDKLVLEARPLSPLDVYYSGVSPMPAAFRKTPQVLKSSRLSPRPSQAKVSSSVDLSITAGKGALKKQQLELNNTGSSVHTAAYKLPPWPHITKNIKTKGQPKYM